MKKLINPVSGAILQSYPTGHIYQGFGENHDLYHKAVCIPNCELSDCCLAAHNGADIAMKEGTPLQMSAGIVVEVKNDAGGYGRHIRVLTDPDENGDQLELTWGHCKDIFVPLGMRVKDYQIGGTMGNTGFIISGNTPYWGNAPAGKGVHCHFGVRECSIRLTRWEVKYADTHYRTYIKNYDNGFFGHVDPLSFIEQYPDVSLGLLTIKEALAIIMQKVRELFIKKNLNYGFTAFMGEIKRS